MTCSKCGSENVNIQVVSDVKSNGGKIPFWYWACFVWMLDMILYCCIVGFFGLNIHSQFKKTRTKAKTYAVCQSCGNKWLV